MVLDNNFPQPAHSLHLRCTSMLYGLLGRTLEASNSAMAAFPTTAAAAMPNGGHGTMHPQSIHSPSEQASPPSAPPTPTAEQKVAEGNGAAPSATEPVPGRASALRLDQRWPDSITSEAVADAAVSPAGACCGSPDEQERSSTVPCRDCLELSRAASEGQLHDRMKLGTASRGTSRGDMR